MVNIADLNNILKDKRIEFTISKINHTTEEAAETIGCTVNEMAKSHIFMGFDTSMPSLIIVSKVTKSNPPKKV